jgi:hypothetical protein
VSEIFGIFTGVLLAAVGIAAAVVLFVRKRAGAIAETERWAHAAQLSAMLVRDPGAAGRPSAVSVHNNGTADVSGVTLVIREKETGVYHVTPDAHILSPGYELRLTVPTWACSSDRQLFVRFFDATELAWDLDVSTGLLREALMVGGRG